MAWSGLNRGALGGHCMHSSIVLLVVLTAGKFPLSWPLRLSPCTPFHISLHTEPSCCVPGKHTTLLHTRRYDHVSQHIAPDTRRWIFARGGIAGFDGVQERQVKCCVVARCTALAVAFPCYLLSHATRESFHSSCTRLSSQISVDSTSCRRPVLARSVASSMSRRRRR